MKANIHPKFYLDTKVICICGNRFTTGSTQETIHVELCSDCHPFYTGTQKFVDAGSLIKKFQNKQVNAATYKQTKNKKKEEERKAQEAPKTLREMLIGIK
ncbi:50S ribosomal protein L31 [Patescibacteria group bacterium]|nr:50S ribosomal protein L31 [Patescibacteria group bacterium]MBU4099603.1 50S ribosomal protein L31 [Patescibacteria group bacterium]